MNIAKPFMLALLCAGVAVGVVGSTEVLWAAEASVSSAPLRDFGSSEPPQHGTSTLYRNDNGIAVTIDTRHLRKNSAHTVWLVIFNVPENCAMSPCGAPDLSNDAVEPSLVFGGAAVTGANGRLRLSAGLDIDVAPAPPIRFGFGPGILYPHTAEVHIIVQDHRGVDMDEIHAMLQRPGTGPNGVEDVQSAIHLP